MSLIYVTTGLRLTCVSQTVDDIVAVVQLHTDISYMGAEMFELPFPKTYENTTQRIYEHYFMNTKPQCICFKLGHH